MVLGYGYFTIEELLTSLRSCFNYDEMWTIDFKAYLGAYDEIDDGYVFIIKNKLITIDKILGIVTNVKTLN